MLPGNSQERECAITQATKLTSGPCLFRNHNGVYEEQALCFRFEFSMGRFSFKKAASILPLGPVLSKDVSHFHVCGVSFIPV